MTHGEAHKSTASAVPGVLLEYFRQAPETERAERELQPGANISFVVARGVK